MSTSRHFNIIASVITALAVLLTVLFMNGEALGITKVVDEDRESNSDASYFTTADRDADWDTSDATVITLADDDTVIRGRNAYVNGGSVTITESGTYVISGTLTDGSIVVDAHDSSKVRILLDGVLLSCSDDACIRVEQADKVFLTLAEGSENTVSSGTVYSDEALSDGTGGAVYAHDDLTINGTGSLTVTAGYKHGIEANDDLVIAGGTISVFARGDGIHVNDSFRFADADLTVDAGDDGIDLDGDDSLDAGADNGYFYIESGTLTIKSGDDGIHAAGGVTVSGGEITIAAADDGIHSDTAFAMTDGSLAVTESYEGIEAVTIDLSGGSVSVFSEDDGLNANGNTGAMTGMGGQSGSQDGTVSVSDTWIRISGGSLTVRNENGRDADGLDSNGSVYIEGGDVRISISGASGMNNAIDCGSESGGGLFISGGTLVACGGSSMLEGQSAESSQAGITVVTESAASAGDAVALLDSEGNVLLDYTPDYGYTAVTVSCPEIAVGESYTLRTGDAETVVEVDSTAAGNAGRGFGGMGGFGKSGGMGGFENAEGFENGGMPGRNEDEDGTAEGSADGSGRPQRPGMDKDGERPQRGEGFGKPEDGEMPELPEGAEMPENGEMSMPGQDGEDPGEEAREAAEAEVDETSAPEPAAVTPEQWGQIGLCAGVLLLAILAAVSYKRRR